MTEVSATVVTHLQTGLVSPADLLRMISQNTNVQFKPGVM